MQVIVPRRSVRVMMPRQREQGMTFKSSRQSKARFILSEPRHCHFCTNLKCFTSTLTKCAQQTDDTKRVEFIGRASTLPAFYHRDIIDKNRQRHYRDKRRIDAEANARREESERAEPRRREGRGDGGVPVPPRFLQRAHLHDEAVVNIVGAARAGHAGPTIGSHRTTALRRAVVSTLDPRLEPPPRSRSLLLLHASVR